MRAFWAIFVVGSCTAWLGSAGDWLGIVSVYFSRASLCRRVVKQRLASTVERPLVMAPPMSRL